MDEREIAREQGRSFAEMSNRREGDKLFGTKRPSVNDDGVSILSPQLRESDPYHDVDIGKQAIRTG